MNVFEIVKKMLLPDKPQKPMAESGSHRYGVLSVSLGYVPQYEAG